MMGNAGFTLSTVSLAFPEGVGLRGFSSSPGVLEDLFG